MQLLGMELTLKPPMMTISMQSLEYEREYTSVNSEVPLGVDILYELLMIIGILINHQIC